MSELKKKSVIYIDNREKDQKILEMFSKQTIFDVEIKYLELGDIIFNGLCIERKSISDFLNSVREERFWINISDMKSYFAHQILWIDTSPKDIMREMAYRCRRGGKYAYETYVGSKIRITLMNIPIVEMPAAEAEDYFISMFRKIESDGNKNGIPLNIKKSGVPIQKRRIDSISRVEGVGVASAKLLIEQYSTIENIINASKEKDSKIMKGIRVFFCE